MEGPSKKDSVIFQNVIRDVISGAVYTLSASTPCQPPSNDAPTKNQNPNMAKLQRIFEDDINSTNNLIERFYGQGDYIRRIAKKWQLYGVISEEDEKLLISFSYNGDIKGKRILVHTVLGKEKLKLATPFDLSQIQALDKRAIIYKSFNSFIKGRIERIYPEIGHTLGPDQLRNQGDKLRRHLNNLLSLLCIPSDLFLSHDRNHKLKKYLFTANIADFFEFLLTRFRSEVLNCEPVDYDFSLIPYSDKLRLLNLYINALASLDGVIEEGKIQQLLKDLSSRLSGILPSPDISPFIRECLEASAKEANMTPDELSSYTSYFVTVIEAQYQRFLNAFRQQAISTLTFMAKKAKNDYSFEQE